MGGSGFGHVIVKIPNDGVQFVNGFPVPGKQLIEDSVQVNVVGTLTTGVMAIGGETTGTTITSSDIVWELMFTEKQSAQASELNGKKVKVTGQLEKRKGVEIGDRWIVSVTSLETAENSDELNVDTNSSFRRIMVQTSGGIAGLVQHKFVFADGSVKVTQGGAADGEMSKLTAEKLKAIKLHVANTDWSKVPRESRDRGLADGMQYDFEIDTGFQRLTFTVDSSTLRNQKPLRRLLELMR
jgi:hypothetical protein